MIEQGILYTDAVSEFEKKFIKQMLEKNKGNHSKAAVALGIHRNTQTPRRRRPLSGCGFLPDWPAISSQICLDSLHLGHNSVLPVRTGA